MNDDEREEGGNAVPRYYYDALVEMGHDNVCAGIAVEGLGYIIPEIVVTPQSVTADLTFYDLNVNNIAVAETSPRFVYLLIFERRYPSVYHHHKVAIEQRGKPTFLTIDLDRENAKIRRNQATGRYPSPMDGYDKDEYPYAMTMQGGTGASVMYVPRHENRSHGNYIGTIRRAYNMQTGDIFDVRLVKDELKENPAPLPEPVLRNLPEQLPPLMPVFAPLERETSPIPLPDIPRETARDALQVGGTVAFMAVLFKILDRMISRTVYPIFLTPIDPAFHQSVEPEYTEKLY